MRISLKKKKDVLFDIDWQGYQQLKQSGQDVVGIFILPPSKKELIQRLEKRGRDTKSEMKKRMNLVQDEISHFPEYDYVVINKDINKCALSDLKYHFYRAVKKISINQHYQIC